MRSSDLEDEVSKKLDRHLLRRWERLVKPRSTKRYTAREAKGSYSLLPETDKRVWTDGLEAAGIFGSMVGVPLTMGTQLGPTVVAVMILWNVTTSEDRERLSDVQCQAIIQRCKGELSLELRLREAGTSKHP